MLSIYEMSTRGDEDNRQMADLLLRNVFYERETLDLLVDLVKSYRPNWAPRQYVHQQAFLFCLFVVYLWQNHEIIEG